jgi:hypothetical protein
LAQQKHLDSFRCYQPLVCASRPSLWRFVGGRGMKACLLTFKAALLTRAKGYGQRLLLFVRQGPGWLQLYDAPLGLASSCTHRQTKFCCPVLRVRLPLLQVFDSSLLRFAVRLTHSLDDKFGQQHKRMASLVRAAPWLPGLADMGTLNSCSNEDRPHPSCVVCAVVATQDVVPSAVCCAVLLCCSGTCRASPARPSQCWSGQVSRHSPAESTGSVRHLEFPR